VLPLRKTLLKRELFNQKTLFKSLIIKTLLKREFFNQKTLFKSVIIIW
jgi:hypothetical protein